MNSAVGRAARNLAFATLLLLFAVMTAHAVRADDSSWAGIRAGLYQDRVIESGGETVKLFAPRRADDAALVPIRMFIAGDAVAKAQTLTLIVDENPAPVAAVFRFGEPYRAGGNIGDRTIETRVRLENMSNVRIVLETDDGRLYEASQFVAAAGGCTSASLKDMDEALAGLGKTRFRVGQDATRGEDWSELVINIRHPNFSGMQIDTRTNAFAPAHFVEHVDVRIGDEDLVSIESGIAISEDPHFRLSFAGRERMNLSLVARDTEGGVFQANGEQ